MNADRRTAAKTAELSVIVKGARLAFGSDILFDGLDFALTGGQWTCLLGPSGVGKTTLLRMIAGLVQPMDGARIAAGDGESLSGRVAYMGQQDLLMPWLSLIDNVTVGYRLRGELTPDIATRGRELLARVGLGDRTEALPAECSGGMRQRAALARTLLEDRPIVLMDEPFSSLDAITRVRLQELAVDLLRERTVLLVTHDPLEALRLGHGIMVMSGAPARLDHIEPPPGPPPRDPNDPELLAKLGQLLTTLAAGGEGA